MIEPLVTPVREMRSSPFMLTMEPLAKGAVDPRTGRKVGDYANWTTHPNNPSVRAAE